jgi:hypothetical protein
MTSFFQIQYAGTSSTITSEFLPIGTTEDQAISIARDYKADLWKGFVSLREVREITISQEPPSV